MNIRISSVGLALYAAIALAPANAVPRQPDSAWTTDIVRSSLAHPQAFTLLTELTRIGGRPAGSSQAERAVQWGRDTMTRLGFQNIRLEPARVSHWVRGKTARAEMMGERNGKLAVCALGNSVGTPTGGITAEIVEISSLKEAEALGDAGRGKILFFNRPMDPALTATFAAYGGAVDQRVRGASAAAKSGALAVLVRSMTLSHDDYPHTGTMVYAPDAVKIPAAALSTTAADHLSQRLKEDPHLRVRLELDCKTLPEADSSNVVGEIVGAQKPDEIVLMGGHLDSWDLAQGAHDDGAGVVQSLEALRILKDSGFRPMRTIRVVLFMDEENSGGGAEAYAAAHKTEKHVAAIESDDGGFMPRAFTTSAKEEPFDRIRAWQPLLTGAGIERISAGGGGADISPLASQGAILFGLEPDNQRYFDYHHSALDTLDKVHPRELELGAIAMAILARLLSDEL